ncbi:porin family protein [Fulvivirga sp.]|uniref:porin family protein n=1 Tax=Fulvivirga sp. TaxID=1931237 RepID=UPI0032EEF74E
MNKLTAMRTVVLVIGFLAVATLSNAQIKLGVKGGLNVSGYFFEPDPENDDLKPLSSFHLGGFMMYSFADNFGLQVELMYSGEGGRLVGEDFDGTGLLGGGTVDSELKDRYSFLAFPVLGKYHSSSGFTAEAGIIFNILLKAKTSYALSNDTQEIAFIEDFNDSVNGVDTRFGLGIGYEMASGLSLNGRYSFSLGNIYTEEYTADSNGLEAGLGVFQLSVGFPIYAK